MIHKWFFLNLGFTRLSICFSYKQVLEKLKIILEIIGWSCKLLPCKGHSFRAMQLRQRENDPKYEGW